MIKTDDFLRLTQNEVSQQLKVANPVFLKTGALGLLVNLLTIIKTDSANFTNSLVKEASPVTAETYESLFFHSTIKQQDISFSTPATFTVSFIIDYTSAFLPVYSGDRLLSSLFGAVTGGAGLALVFARNATTGGVDTAAKLIKLKHPHLSMGRIILFFDILVVGSSFFVYRSVENLLYSIIVIYLSSKTIDYLLYGTGDGKLIFIVTEHGKEIKEKITKDFRRGVSVLNARGGYTDKEKSVLITAVKIQEAAFITAAVKETDPKAFSVITGADEIIGEGFRY